MNRGIEVLQTSALPLGYVAAYHLKMARVGGFEPPSDGIRIRCLTTWRYPTVCLKFGVDDGARTHECRNHNPVS